MKAIWSAIDYVRHGQFRLLLHGLIRRLPAFVYRRSSGYIFERSPECHNSWQACRRATRSENWRSNDVAACAQLSGLSEQEIRRRFEQGERCLGVLGDAKQLVNLSWLHFGPCYVRGLGLRLDLGEKDCYVYGVVTHPDHRGMGLYRWTQHELMRILKEQAVPRIVQLVEDGNEAPLRLFPNLATS